MPDPYQFPPGDQPADDPVRPAAGPDGGEQGTNEHGASTNEVATVAGGAQGGGYSQATSGAAITQDPSLADDFADEVHAPTITSFTPSTGTLGTSITVTGTNLANTVAVKVNGVAAALVSKTSTTVVFTIGAAASGGGSTGKIEIDTLHDGDVVSATNLTVT